LFRSILNQGVKELGLAISTGDIATLEIFAGELLKWNRKINLTSVLAIDEIAIKHFLDSLVLAEQISSAASLLDIGSGAGIPAIPVKIFKPSLNVVSVDAVEKKILFQRHAARLLNLEGFEAIHVRVENLHKQYARSFNIITSRAFSSLERFVEIVHPLLAVDGRIIAMKGPAGAEEIKVSESAIHKFGYEVLSQYDYCLPFAMGKRSLISIVPVKGQ